MTNRAAILTSALLATVSAGLAAQSTPEPKSVLDRIRREALERSQVVDAFSQFVTVIGPRLTGSPNYKRAADWSRERLASYGLTNAHLETWEFGRGWVLDRQVIEMVEPNYMPLIGYAEAWSAPTQGELVGAPVSVAGRSAADVAAMKDTLAGAIVLTYPIVTQFVREDRAQPTASDQPVRIGAPPMPRPGGLAADTRLLSQALRDAKAGVLLRPSYGEHGTVFALGRDQGDNAMPMMVLAAEHYNMIARMVEKGVPVKLRVGIKARYLTDDTKGYNVVADLPGTDPALKDEVVMLGAHLDSWHSATGATDNADGSAVVIEALRILKAIDARPRRTIRVGIWGGEEEGLLGSKAYVKQHLEGDANQAARDKFAVYLNIDPGMGPIYGWYSENSAPAQSLFDAWLSPLKDLDARRNIGPGITNTDHLSFKAVGVPGFNPIQDYVTYDVRTHHTNMDTYERVREQDLKQNAVVMAWFAYNAAMMDGKFPR
ncbi:MAG TPA: M20/M25/M40 family metallo-hydrolase [Vicinamibacterales bacterium]